MAEPPRHAWLEHALELGADIQKRDSRPAEQPFEPARAVEVRIEGHDVYRQLSRRLVAVHQAQRTVAVGYLGDGADILDRPRCKEYVTGRNQRRAIVDRALETFERHLDTVRALHNHDLYALAPLRDPLIRQAGKVEAREHDARAPAVIE